MNRRDKQRGREREREREGERDRDRGKERERRERWRERERETDRQRKKRLRIIQRTGGGSKTFQTYAPGSPFLLSISFYINSEVKLEEISIKDFFFQLIKEKQTGPP